MPAVPPADPLRIVLVSREVWPFVRGGGIGRYVAESAALLAEHGIDVTILTSSRFADEHAALAAAGDPRIGPASLRWAWVKEPQGDLSPIWSSQHAWSVACWRALREICLAEAPQLVEFEDYGGAAKTTLDAARTADPALTRTRLLVRVHTTWEMTQRLDELPLDGLDGRTVAALERDALRFADRLLVPSEATLAEYRRHYGGDGLAPALVAPMAMRLEPLAPDAKEAPSGVLRLLYVGRMQRLKGVHELVRAFHRVESADVTLTLVGGDTTTGPDGGSMLAELETIAGDDPRIDFRDAVKPDALGALIREHDAVVVPSMFEAFGYVPREALAENRPVIAAAVGGLGEILEPGRSGWVLDEPSADHLHETLAALAERPEQVRSLIASGSPRTVLEERNRPELHVGAYHEAAEMPVRRRASAGDAGRQPLVTALITYNRGDGPIERTLDSLELQGWPRLELVLAVEHGVRLPARLLPRLHALALLEPGQDTLVDARRVGLARRAGRGPLLLLRAGHTVAPGFLERGVAAFAADPELPYVTAHATGRARGCAPLGNHAAQLIPDEPASATVPLLRDDTLITAPAGTPGCEDEELLAALAETGRYGAVVPEPLVGHWRRSC